MLQSPCLFCVGMEFTFSVHLSALRRHSVLLFSSPLCFAQAWWLFFSSPLCFAQVWWLFFSSPLFFAQAWWFYFSLHLSALRMHGVKYFSLHLSALRRHGGCSLQFSALRRNGNYFLPFPFQVHIPQPYMPFLTLHRIIPFLQAKKKTFPSSISTEKHKSKKFSHLHPKRTKE